MEEDQVCLICGEAFGALRSYKKHVAKKVCSVYQLSVEIRDNRHDCTDIVDLMPTTYLKFKACQKLGVFEKGIFPLIFSSKFPAEFDELKDEIYGWFYLQ